MLTQLQGVYVWQCFGTPLARSQAQFRVQNGRGSLQTAGRIGKAGGALTAVFLESLKARGSVFGFLRQGTNARSRPERLSDLTRGCIGQFEWQAKQDWAEGTSVILGEARSLPLKSRGSRFGIILLYTGQGSFGFPRVSLLITLPES